MSPELIRWTTVVTFPETAVNLAAGRVQAESFAGCPSNWQDPYPQKGRSWLLLGCEASGHGHARLARA